MKAPESRVYLPLFYDLTDHSVLIVGGGKAAWQKVKALAAFEVPVIVVSPAFDPALEDAAPRPSSRLTLVRRRWEPADLAGVAAVAPPGLVLACTDDFEINDRVVAEARARALPVLDASRPHLGDFVQPATRRQGSFTLAVSSGGHSPRAAVVVRDAVTAAFEAAVASVSSPSPSSSSSP